MDDAESPCPVPNNKLTAANEYANLTPVVPMPYAGVHYVHQPVEQPVTLYHQQQQQATATVAVFPAIFCGGTVPETTSTASIELQDLPPAAAGVPSPDFSVNSDSDDSSSEKGGPTDPFAPECKIPLPVPYSPFDCWLEPTFIRRRNERERQRVRHVNDGFERLRSRLPLPPRDKDRRLSKVETLRYAISYIKHLQKLLGLADDDDDDEDMENSRCHR